MKTVFHAAADRGFASRGWLKSYHSFSFSSYHDPNKMNFGLLRVLNDDFVEQGMGFGTHGHDNMEIVSIPLSGALKHNDSTGRQEVINQGDVQIMSAGSGIQHSEYNNSKTEPVKFLQVWVFPKQKDIEPRYEQKTFNEADKKNQFLTVVSPKENAENVWINQDAYFSLANIDANQSLDYTLNNPNNGIYTFVLEGNVDVADKNLGDRDALGVYEVSKVNFKANTDTKILVIEVPMTFD